MNANVKYSVIIPACNAEKTLSRCLNSLVRQNREDVQIIVISDGSADKTDEIAGTFSDKVQFVRQEHAGVSAARNRGLSLAKGEYVTFVDSDDYVAEDYFAVLDTAENCDLLVFGVEGLERYGREERLKRLLASRKIMSPCNKRIRRKLIKENNLRFVEGMQMGEDFCFCFSCALAADTIGVSREDIYRVDISNGNSLSRRYRPHLDQQMRRVFNCVAQIDREGRYGAILDWLFAKNVFTCIAEECKRKDLRYFRDRHEIRQICDGFRQPTGSVSGIAHGFLRLMLKYRLDYPIYRIAYLFKGRKFEKCRKRKC